MRFLIGLFALLFLTGVSKANTILVPAQHPTIQAGINAANSGDTVLVADGTYIGPDNKNLDFGGIDIVLISENGPDNCIIDCEYLSRGFYFHSGETSEAEVCGFSIIHGFEFIGGGIYCADSSPTFKQCIIHDCTSMLEGGGIIVFGGSPSFINCTIHSNNSVSGGGIAGDNADLTVNSCIIAANTSSG